MRGEPTSAHANGALVGAAMLQGCGCKKNIQGIIEWNPILLVISLTKWSIGSFSNPSWVVATQIFFIFTPLFGEDEPILTSIFFKGVKTTNPKPWGFLTKWSIGMFSPTTEEKKRKDLQITHVFSQKHRRCLGSRLGDYGRSETECQDPVDGRWTGCGRAGAAEIAWEEARDGGARSNVRIRWTGCGRAGAGRRLEMEAR